MQDFSACTDPFRLIIHGRECGTEEEEEGSKANQVKERIDILRECATGCGDDLCFNIEFRDAIHGAENSQHRHHMPVALHQGFLFASVQSLFCLKFKKQHLWSVQVQVLH